MPASLELEVFDPTTALLLPFTVGVLPDGNSCRIDVQYLLLDDSKGQGMVAYLGMEVSALHYWHRRERGNASLIGFLQGASCDYIARKFKLADEFDRDKTEADVVEELRRGNPENAQEHIDNYMATSERDFDYWLAYNAPRSPGHPSTRFHPRHGVHSRFKPFYRAVWPWLKANRAEVEARLYPEGIPA